MRRRIGDENEKEFSVNNKYFEFTFYQIKVEEKFRREEEKWF